MIATTSFDGGPKRPDPASDFSRRSSRPESDRCRRFCLDGSLWQGGTESQLSTSCTSELLPNLHISSASERLDELVDLGATVLNDATC